MPPNGQRNTGTNPRGSQWVYTLNNYTDDDVLRLQAIHTQANYNVLYHAFQAEVGESGTPHLQGYVAFSNTKMRSTVAKIISARAYLKRAEGTPLEASSYCTDEDKRDPNKMDTIHVHGLLTDVPDESRATRQPGARTDLSECKRLLDEGSAVWDLAETHFSNVVRYHKAFSAYKHYKTVPRDFKTVVFVFYGAPGTGKSRAAFNFNRCFAVPASNGTQWMDGYDPEHHDTVIFDDFHASLPANLLLRLLDEYPLQFPTKGGFTEFRPKAVVLTSNFHPRQWYDWSNIKADYEAFERRVDVMWEYFKPETAPDIADAEEHDLHVLLRCHKGDWHPQQDEFIPLIRPSAEGAPVFGLPIDYIPETVNLDHVHEFYRSLVSHQYGALAPAPASQAESISLSSDSSSSESEDSISSSSP